MPPLPPKKAVALDLLERTSVFVHLDPRRPGVIVPLVFAKQPNLVLQLGLNMAISIPDLEVGEGGISCTLSFNRRPHFCRLPWSAIYALIGQEGGGMVWPEDVPPEVVAQQRSAAKKDVPARKPTLRALDGGALEGGALEGGALEGGALDRGDSADRQGARAAALEAEEEAPPAQRSPSSPPSPLKGEPARKQNLRRTSSLPPRLVQHSAHSDRDATERDVAERNVAERDAQFESAAELETADASRDSSRSPAPATTPPPELATRPESEPAATGSTGKRARPPYLRLVR